MEAVWLALIVAVPAAVVPVVTMVLTRRQNRKDKQADWARQDEVAKQAAEAARLLLDRQEATARKVALVAVTAAETATAVEEHGAAQDRQLERIHVLVNSQATAQIESELNITRQNLALTKRIAAMRAEAGDTATEDEAIVAIEARVAELEAVLADRERQTHVADMLSGD